MGKLPFSWTHQAASPSSNQALFKSSQVSGFLNKKVLTFLRKLGPKGRKKLQKLLQKKINIDAQQLAHFFKTPIGISLLNQLAPLIKEEAQPYSISLLKKIFLQTAADANGLSVANLLQQFPSQIQFDADRLLSEAQRIEQLIKDTSRAVAQIRKLAAKEHTHATQTLSADLPDLRQRGPWEIKHQELELCDRTRLLPAPIKQKRCSRVLLYFPHPIPTYPVPIIIISHGLGSNPEDFHDYATHLSSYGYAIAIPQHPGSDAAHIRQVLNGDVNELFYLQEFIDRPQDITFVLDVLGSRNQSEFKHKFNLQQVGVIGHSFGGYTALALAGATINFQRLEQDCQFASQSPNPSLLLQCRALNLPRISYNLLDTRVKAILPIDPVGSAVFGSFGLSQIHIPTLILAGSADKLAPILLEAIHTFSSLQLEDSYLALIENKSHLGSFTASPLTDNFIANLMPKQNHQVNILIHEYTCALSIAFFHTYLLNNTAYNLYLEANYLSSLSKPAFPLHFVSHNAAPALKKFRS